MDKEIVDSEGVLKVISALFGKLPVTILSEGKEFTVKVIALKNKALIINTALKFPSKARIMSLVHNGSRFIAQFSLIGGDGNGIEVLQPLKISIGEAKRQGNRVEVSSTSNSALTVTNLINIIDISKAIGFDDKKVDALLLSYRGKLASVFPNSSIFFSGRADNRLRLMQHYDKPIYIVDRKNKSTANPMYLPFDEYLRIFDTSKLTEDLISEISVPIRYKNYLSLGYVQILSDKPLDMDAFEKLTIFSQAVSRDIVATGVFQESKEICQVMDLSAGGISFLHAPTRAFSRNVTMNGTLIFDVTMGPDKRGTFRGIIKNIRNQETNYRVGCQFYNTNPTDLEILETYLGLDKPKSEEPSDVATESEEAKAESKDSDETEKPASENQEEGASSQEDQNEKEDPVDK
jgi:hypothetical protein